MNNQLEHDGTKYEHSKQNAAIDKRTPFNYCPLCNGWFPRHDQLAQLSNN